MLNSHSTVLTNVTVIIPVYEVTDYLAAALASVLQQAGAVVEIMVVDDGSGTAAAAQIVQLCGVDDRIRLLRQENTGQAIARRNGLLHARGEFVLFLDADDVLLPGALAHLSASLRAQVDAIGAYGLRVQMDMSGAFLNEKPTPALRDAVSGDILPTLLRGTSLLSNGSCLIRRAALLQVEFPENMRQGEDWVTWCRLALLGEFIYAGSRVVLGIRQHAANVSREVLLRPQPLFAMLPVVFNDPAFALRIGEAALAHYRTRHRLQIHRYLYRHHISGKRWLRALGQRYQIHYWQRQLPRKIKVLHVVKWFYAGGAERIVSGLLQHSDRDQFAHAVLSLSHQHERMGQVQRQLGIPYRAIEIGRGKVPLLVRLRCLWLMGRERPDVVQTWLPPSNILGGQLAKSLGKPVVWGIHDAQVTPPEAMEKRQQIALSPTVPEQIICCSPAVVERCLIDGYDPDLLRSILNGTDTHLFTRQASAYLQWRKILSLQEGALLIGMAAEYTPIKRHDYFLAAAKIFVAKHPHTQFLFCGKGTQSEELAARIAEMGLTDNVHVLGIRNDMAEIYSALDIHTLCSQCESFGLATTEALACETYSVATEVGMAPALLKGVGGLIPVDDDPMLLVDAWNRYQDCALADRQAMAQQGRARVMADYSLAAAAAQYDAVWREYAAN